MKLVLWILCLGILVGDAAFLEAAQQVVLTGIVSSQAEGAMEGVLLSAKRVGGTITLTVVSDHAGRYAYTASQLAQGGYELSIRATGYKTANPKPLVMIGKGKNQADIRLQNARDLASQL